MTHVCQRLDLAGPLLGNLFRMLFKKLTKDMRTFAQKVCTALLCLQAEQPRASTTNVLRQDLDSNKEPNLRWALKPDTISNRLRVCGGIVEGIG